MFQRPGYCPVPFAAHGAHTEVHGVRGRGSGDATGGQEDDRCGGKEEMTRCSTEL